MAHLSTYPPIFLQDMNDLRRRCDFARPGRKAAAPLFWTLGAQQVGKAAISGWRDMLTPAVQNPALDVALWPFAGALTTLLETRKIVVAETYPAECYTHVGLEFGSGQSKRKQADRAENGRRMVAWADNHDVILTPHLEEALVDGFGTGGDGEDPFDAVVGLLGMIIVVQKGRPAGVPTDPAIRRVEGWILGQVKGPGQ